MESIYKRISNLEVELESYQYVKSNPDHYPHISVSMVMEAIKHKSDEILSLKRKLKKELNGKNI